MSDPNQVPFKGRKLGFHTRSRRRIVLLVAYLYLASGNRNEIECILDCGPVVEPVMRSNERIGVSGNARGIFPAKNYLNVHWVVSVGRLTWNLFEL
jgi:hypothetical protein